MSAGSRDQRLRVFSFSETSVDGRSSSGYAFAGEYWGRVEAPSAGEATVAGQGQHVIDAVISLERDVPLNSGDVIKSRNDSRHYKITGLPPFQRTDAERKAFAVHADDSTFAITGEPVP